MIRLPRLTHVTDRHLTDEQMYTLLDTTEQPESSVRLHLDTCAACQTELASLNGALSNFRVAATGLAAAQPARLVRRAEVSTALQPSAFRRPLWAVSLASAAALVAVSVSVIRPPHPAPVAPAPVTVSAPAIAESDDALLDGIQRDLSASIPPSLAPLAIQPSQGAKPN